MADASSPPPAGADSSPARSASPAPPAVPDDRSSWIDDEATLRDEGVLYGLVGDDAGLRAKEEAIRRHFDIRMGRIDRRRNQLDAALEEVTERRREVEHTIDRLTADIDDPAEPPLAGGAAPDVAPHYFLRYLVGLLLAAGLCAFNYVLIYELVRPAFTHPWFVAAGVLTAGMFALFQPSSLLYNNDADQGLLHDAPAELWKQRVSEFGVPLAAALFAVVWRAETLGLVKTGAVFLFVFMLFLFGGKLFLSILPQISLVARNVLRNRRIRDTRSRHRSRIQHLEDEVIPALRDEADALRTERFALPEGVEVEAACERALALFRSEAALARDAGDAFDLSPAQRRSLSRYA